MPPPPENGNYLTYRRESQGQRIETRACATSYSNSFIYLGALSDVQVAATADRHRLIMERSSLSLDGQHKLPCEAATGKHPRALSALVRVCDDPASNDP